MSVTRIDTDPENLALTLIADFDAPVERVWELWADPRKLERWWGPPAYPATVKSHELTPGGQVTYLMTGPEGDTHHGWWDVTTVDPPNSLAFTDGFADESGERVADMPTMDVVVRLSEHDGGTRMELRSTFSSREEMDRMLDMGMAEGLREAVGQMDGLLEQEADRRD
jgi:uncharacterized protein YndB with AHSA1/START domain